MAQKRNLPVSYSRSYCWIQFVEKKVGPKKCPKPKRGVRDQGKVAGRPGFIPTIRDFGPALGTFFPIGILFKEYIVKNSFLIRLLGFSELSGIYFSCFSGIFGSELLATLGQLRKLQSVLVRRGLNLQTLVPEDSDFPVKPLPSYKTDIVIANSTLASCLQSFLENKPTWH